MCEQFLIIDGVCVVDIQGGSFVKEKKCPVWKKSGYSDDGLDFGDLLPCPFCGNNAITETSNEFWTTGLSGTIHTRTGCHKCGIYFEERSKHNTVINWNRRANLA